MSLRNIIILNFIISACAIAIALIYPFFIEKVYFSNKSNEATSISSQIAKIQNINYAKSNQYISLIKNDKENLINNFQISVNDIKYYEYSIYTTFNSYTLYAEPKIKYLRNREISPRIFIYSKTLNQEAKFRWE
jgi:hypothetical protein